MLLYIFYKIGFFGAKILPVRVCYFLSNMFAGVYFFFAFSEKKEMSETLRVVLGEGISESSLAKIKKRIFSNFGKYLVDFFKFPVFTKEDIKKTIDVSGLEYLEECLHKGSGAIMLSLHLGNWELGGAVLSSLGYPMNALVLRHDDKRVNDFFDKQRRLNGLNTICLGAAVRKGFKVLKGNGCLAIVADKDYTGSGMRIDMFGKKAVLPKGPAVFALKTGAPIIVTTLRRKEDDTFCLALEPPLFFDKTSRITDEKVREVMEDYVVYFEKYIHENVEQWYAFKNIWKPQ